jgi:hypothetical protein
MPLLRTIAAPQDSFWRSVSSIAMFTASCLAMIVVMYFVTPWLCSGVACEVDPDPIGTLLDMLRSLASVTVLAITALMGARILVEADDDRQRSIVALSHQHRLDVRGVAVSVNGQDGGDIWQALASGARVTPVEANSVPAMPADDEAAPLSAFARAFKTIAPAIPAQWPVPVLVCPCAGATCASPDKAAEALDYFEYRFVMHSAPEGATCAVTAAFDLFSQHPSMWMLLVASADGRGFHPGASGETVSNATLMLLTRPDRIARMTRPPDLEFEATISKEFTGRALLDAFDRELENGGKSTLSMDANRWSVLAESFVTNARNHQYRPEEQGVYLPTPCSATLARAIETAPTLGTLHRPISLRPDSKDSAEALTRDDCIKAWSIAASRLPEGITPVTVLTENDVSSDLFTVLHELINDKADRALGDARQVIDGGHRVGRLGESSSLTTVALAITASQSSGSASAVLLNTVGDPCIVMTSPSLPASEPGVPIDAVGAYRTSTKVTA